MGITIIYIRLYSKLIFIKNGLDHIQQVLYSMVMKYIPTHEELLADIDRYLKKLQMRSHDFGKKFLNDSGAVSRLRNGADPRLSTVQKIYKVLKDK
jgi:predicted transcriptional regulator